MPHPVPAPVKFICRVLGLLALAVLLSVQVFALTDIAEAAATVVIPRANPHAPLPCLRGLEKWQGRCLPRCPPGQVHLPPNGACAALVPTLCLAPRELWKGKCVPKCASGMVHLAPDGRCICGANGTELWHGKCVHKCPKGMVHLQRDGHCGKAM